MAQGAVAAITIGLNYQAHWFWQQAADLLLPDKLVDKVVFEHDAYPGADDVVVYYRSPGRDVFGTCIQADLYQVKYHVDQQDDYTWESLIRPPKEGRSSLLQHLHRAYQRAASDFTAFRIHLVSNWRGRDLLLDRVRQPDGALPAELFSQRSSQDLGKVRTAWAAHLKLDEAAFAAFARTLRCDLSQPPFAHLREQTYDKLRAAGLKVPEASSPVDPVVSIYQTLLSGGTTTLDETRVRELCDRSGLVPAAAPPARARVIGLRSFTRGADGLESETDELACVARYFDGRTPRTPESWELATREVLAFFAEPGRVKRLRERDHELHVECLLTFAFAAGYEASRNIRARLYPFQKPMPAAWKPDVTRTGSPAEWHVVTQPREASAMDLAVVLSVTNPASPAVARYLDAAGVAVRALVELKPCAPGSTVPQTGPSSIHDADHAYQLALSFKALADRLRPSSEACVHLFSAAPASLLFFIGQLREGLGPVQLYEYDSATGIYQPSVRFHAGRLVSSGLAPPSTT